MTWIWSDEWMLGFALVHNNKVNFNFKTPYLGRCGVCGKTRIPAARLLCHTLPSREHTGLEYVKRWCEQSVQSERGGGGWGRCQAHPVRPLPVWAGSRAGAGGGAWAATGRRRPQTLACDSLGGRGWLEGAWAWHSSSPEGGAVGQASSAWARDWGWVEEEGACRVLQVQTGCPAAQWAPHVIHIELNFPGQVPTSTRCAGFITIKVLRLIFQLGLWLCCQQRERVIAHLNVCALHSSSGHISAHATIAGAAFNKFLMGFVVRACGRLV